MTDRLGDIGRLMEKIESEMTKDRGSFPAKTGEAATQHLATLTGIAKQYLKNEELRVGDVVNWKCPDLAPYRFSDPMIVIEVLEYPIRFGLSGKLLEAIDSNFYTPLDVRVAVINSKGQYVTNLVDSHTLTKDITK